MKNLLILCVFCSQVFGILFAQKFDDDIVFEVSRYDIHQRGYPSRIIGDGEGNTLYYEYWEPGSGRKFSGYYLQSLNSDFAENWFHPVYSKPELKFEPDNLFALDKNIVVTGYEYNPKEKKWAGQAHFINKEGISKAFVPMDPAALKKFEAGYSDQYGISPDQKRLVRMHLNTSLGSKSPVYVTSLLSEGRAEWASLLKLPFMDEKYRPVKVAVDNSGKVWFLMTWSGLSGKFETDKNFPPCVVVYDFRENKYLTWKSNLNGVSIPLAGFDISPDGNICLAMAGSEHPEKGFLQGARTGKTFMISKVYYYTLKVDKEITIIEESKAEIPDALIEKFKIEGADFESQGKIVFESGYAIWLLESSYTQQKDQGKIDFYTDVLIIPFKIQDLVSGKIQVLEKKQRDRAGTVMCSYTPATTQGKVYLIYLSSVGADGKIYSETLNLEDMQLSRTEILSNIEGEYYFYPLKSGQTGRDKLMLMGLGNTSKQEYRLIRISL